MCNVVIYGQYSVRQQSEAREGTGMKNYSHSDNANMYRPLSGHFPSRFFYRTKNVSRSSSSEANLLLNTHTHTQKAFSVIFFFQWKIYFFRKGKCIWTIGKFILHLNAISRMFLCARYTRTNAMMMTRSCGRECDQLKSLLLSIRDKLLLFTIGWVERCWKLIEKVT